MTPARAPHCAWGGPAVRGWGGGGGDTPGAPARSAAPRGPRVLPQPQRSETNARFQYHGKTGLHHFMLIRRAVLLHMPFRSSFFVRSVFLLLPCSPSSLGHKESQHLFHNGTCPALLFNWRCRTACVCFCCEFLNLLDGILLPLCFLAHCLEFAENVH